MALPDCCGLPAHLWLGSSGLSPASLTEKPVGTWGMGWAGMGASCHLPRYLPSYFLDKWTGPASLADRR